VAEEESISIIFNSSCDVGGSSRVCLSVSYNYFRFLMMVMGAPPSDSLLSCCGLSLIRKRGKLFYFIAIGS
jgi:hypothetical protein